MDKKIFGKINIIDIILVVIVLVLIVVAYLLFGNKVAGGSETSKYIFQYEMQNVYKDVAESVTVGDNIYDNETNEYVGTVKAVEIMEYKIPVPNFKDDVIVNTAIPDKYVALITLENSLIDSGKDLLTQQGYVIKIGKQEFVRGPNYAGGGYIVYIERADENENN